MKLIGYDINTIYKNACEDLCLRSNYVTSRELVTKELFNVQARLYNPLNRFVSFKSRNMDFHYFVGELCHYLDGRTDLKSIAHYSKFWEQVSDDGKTINSCYGARIFGTRPPPLKGPWPEHSWRGQFKYTINCLTKDKNSRKAVIVIYDESDARPSKDNPCTLSLQFIIRDNVLHMFTNMRSQDIWLGVPYDFAFFTIVHEIAHIELLKTYPKLRLGVYYHNVTSLHAYSRNFEQLLKLTMEDECELIVAPHITKIDVDDWFDDLLTYEKSTRGVVLYKNESRRTLFQDWCKKFL